MARNGHQPGSGTYHHHINPICLRAQLNDNVTVVSTGRLGTLYAEKTSGWMHSPILGWANDGYPVYGPYGYADPTSAKSAIKRIQSSFQLRSITQRHTLPTWILPYLPNDSATLTSTQYGPDVSTTYPLGRYVDDYDYVAGSGDLDQYNGRFTVTPDYPNGTYAYFVTIDSTGAPTFPYIINLQFYGTAAGGSTQTVASDAVDYFTNGAVVGAASTDPTLASWFTKGSLKDAQAITGFDPSAGPSTTWPTTQPSGVMVSGGQSTPALGDAQRGPLRCQRGLCELEQPAQLHHGAVVRSDHGRRLLHELAQFATGRLEVSARPVARDDENGQTYLILYGTGIGTADRRRNSRREHRFASAWKFPARATSNIFTNARFKCFSSPRILPISITSIPNSWQATAMKSPTRSRAAEPTACGPISRCPAKSRASNSGTWLSQDVAAPISGSRVVPARGTDRQHTITSRSGHSHQA
jgi:hypothetical protein